MIYHMTLIIQSLKIKTIKNKLFIIVPLIVIILIVTCLGLFNKSEQVQPFDIKTYEQEIKDFSAKKKFGYIRCMGNIKNSTIAKKYALKIWLEVYGERVQRMKPYKVYWDDENNAWLVTGTLRKNKLGGIPYVIFSKDDGEIIAVWHTR